jgi:hypothetical protein
LFSEFDVVWGFIDGETADVCGRGPPFCLRVEVNTFFSEAVD